MNLLEIIKKAESEEKAIGHFNIANLEMLKAISHVAADLNLPVIIGTSEGEADYVGIHHAVDLINSYNKEHGKENGYHLFLNSDHTRSLDNLKKAVEVGYDMVIFDGADKSFEENIKFTKEAVEEAKKINPNVLVEGELGYIGKSSKFLDEVPKGAKINPEDLPTPEEAKEFVERTGVDLLAPAVGNIHGMMRGAKNPDLNINRIKEIKEATGVPLVLHGGSGVSDEDFKEAIKAGISMIHISTEMRVAWRSSLEKSLKENPDQLAPYKIIPPVVESIERVVKNRIKLFN
ncbi:MAG: class II fructose-bisphosphate aldolase [Candidatus Paceibacterota bacterium]